MLQHIGPNDTNFTNRKVLKALEFFHVFHMGFRIQVIVQGSRLICLTSHAGVTNLLIWSHQLTT